MHGFLSTGIVAEAVHLSYRWLCLVMGRMTRDLFHQRIRNDSNGWGDSSEDCLFVYSPIHVQYYYHHSPTHELPWRITLRRRCWMCVWVVILLWIIWFLFHGWIILFVMHTLTPVFTGTTRNIPLWMMIPFTAAEEKVGGWENKNKGVWWVIGWKGMQ